jgi:hypothetical protein
MSAVRCPQSFLVVLTGLIGIIPAAQALECSDKMIKAPMARFFRGARDQSDSRPIHRPGAMLKPRPSIQTGLPRLPASPFHRAVPITPVDRTGACVDCFPVRAVFPAIRSGRHPHRNFRGLLRLHSHYGPLDRSAAQCGLCHEAPIRPIARPNRSSATRSIDNSLGGTFLHW